MTSISDNNSYVSICSDFTKYENLFKIFKQHPTYTQILEHASLECAYSCISFIEKSDIDKNKIYKCRENDEQGSPNVQYYNNPLFDGISPSTIRYIKVLSEIIGLFGSQDGKSIAEIGVGYGGQCKIINDYFKIQDYNLFDLGVVLDLTKKYLSKYGYTNVYYDNQLKESYDLVISNYAITECNREVQKYYIDNILNKSEHGYITCNFISNLFNIDSMSKEEFIYEIKKDTKIIDEFPLTNPSNFILIW